MATLYDQRLIDADESRRARDEIADKFDDPEETLRQRAFNHDADAYLAIQEALAEQARIANLISIGIAPTMDITVKDGRPVQELLTPEVRAAALRMALRGLGL